MSAPPVVRALGLVDARGVSGTSGVRATWSELEAEPPGTARTFRALFGRPDATFRRIDRASKALVLAAEAAGLSDRLPREVRRDTAVVIETERGCLEADLRFRRGLDEGLVEGAVFPYTLPSASLGEVALRHGLRGPASCLSITPDERGEALREAARLLEQGEAPFVLAGRVEVLADERAGLGPALHAIVALLAPAGTDGGDHPFPHGPGDGWERLAAGLVAGPVPGGGAGQGPPTPGPGAGA